MKILRNLMEIGGLVAIVVGCGQVYRPLVWIAGGAALLLVAFCCWALEK